MTLAQDVWLLSAALGAGGTLVLFLGSYAFAPYQGSFFGPAIATNARIKTENDVRRIKQRTGLALLCASFVAQAIAVVLAG